MKVFMKQQRFRTPTQQTPPTHQKQTPSHIPTFSLTKNPVWGGVG